MGTIERDDKKLDRTTAIDAVSAYTLKDDQATEILTHRRTRFLLEFRDVRDSQPYEQLSSIQNFYESPPIDFRVLGLSVLNPEPDCEIHNFSLSNYVMMNAVPARYFTPENVKSLEELKKMALENRELLPMTSWIGGQVVHSGQSIHLTLRGKCEAAIIWGDLVRRSMPMHDIQVIKQGNMFKATLKVRRWDDEPFETVLSASTISEEGALMLVQTELQKYGQTYP